MYYQPILYLLIFLFSFNISNAQEDPVLFSVNGKEVRVSEFLYIYNKTNNGKAKYDEASLKEYLDLYINFKLQVAEGVDIGLDNDPQVKREQIQYKKQLASTYLTDKEITEKLVKEAYERSKEDRSISHILIACDEIADQAAVDQAKTRAEQIRAQLSGDNFADLAKQYSDDSYSKSNGGDLGFFTALQLPYELETAVYNTEAGAIAEIVRTKHGFHITKVNEIRPAYGKLKVAHLLIRHKFKRDSKALIDSLHAEIMNGASFEDLIKTYSQDNSTNKRGGQLGWVSINQYSTIFENAIFGLMQDGNISKPVQSNAGWHILKRYNAVKNPKYQDVKSEITNTIKRKPRYEIIQNALVAEIKKDGKYKENETAIQLMIDTLTNQNFLSYQWRLNKDEKKDAVVLFEIGDFKGTVGEFMMLAQRSQSERMSKSGNNVSIAVRKILDKLAVEKCLAYEETQLEFKYPEFKALMREYEEGILLFEVKKQLVWDKASSDEEGLKAYYETAKEKFKWSERANATFYTVKSNDAKLIKKVQSKAKSKSADAVKSMFNADEEIVQTTSGIYEKGKNETLDALNWKAGTVGEGKQFSKDNFTFIKIEEILSPSVKSLEEARGYVVADYQDHLEKKLIEQLKEKFEIKINEEVLKNLQK